MDQLPLVFLAEYCPPVIVGAIGRKRGAAQELTRLVVETNSGMAGGNHLQRGQAGPRRKPRCRPTHGRRQDIRNVCRVAEKHLVASPAMENALYLLGSNFRHEVER